MGLWTAACDGLCGWLRTWCTTCGTTRWSGSVRWERQWGSSGPYPVTSKLQDGLGVHNSCILTFSQFPGPETPTPENYSPGLNIRSAGLLFQSRTYPPVVHPSSRLGLMTVVQGEPTTQASWRTLLVTDSSNFLGTSTHTRTGGPDFSGFVTST
ncbi:hypothetical protein EDB84DRAFT_1486814 [Lactarius hengduanensis]|nr:hypothetical protein EDB84DRAFT_1486814 [Lactarius hengduanensis]